MIRGALPGRKPGMRYFPTRRLYALSMDFSTRSGSTSISRTTWLSGRRSVLIFKAGVTLRDFSIAWAFQPAQNPRWNDRRILAPVPSERHELGQDLDRIAVLQRAVAAHLLPRELR